MTHKLSWSFLYGECREIQLALRNETDPAEIAILKQLEAYVFADLQAYIDNYDRRPPRYIFEDRLQFDGKQKLQAALDRLKFNTEHLG